VFNREVHDVRIRILSETFQRVLDDGCAGKKGVEGHVIEAVIDGHRIPNVAIRVRGNTSKCNAKRQFRLSFDKDEMYQIFQGKRTVLEFPENDDRTFFGLDTLNLRTSTNDPSSIRERLSSQIFAKAEDYKKTAIRGGLVYRVAFARLHVSNNRTESQGAEGSFNRLLPTDKDVQEMKDRGQDVATLKRYWYDYKGFYSLAENIDKTFIKMRFQEADESLKGTFIQADRAGAFLHPQKYSREGWEAELVKGDRARDEDELAAADGAIIKLGESLVALDKTKNNEGAINNLIDVENVVNYTAGAILTGHWDSLIANRNNDYLYFDDKVEKWKIVVWDLDNSLGVIHSEFKNRMNQDIFNVGKGEFLLFDTVFSSPNDGFRQLLKTRLKQFVDDYYGEVQFNERVGSFETQVQLSSESWEGHTENHYQDIRNFAKARRALLGPILK
jgi:spore coat protein CotH